MYKKIMTTSGKALAMAVAAALAGCGGGDVGPGDFAYGSAPRCAKTLLVDDGLTNTQLALTRLNELINLASISPEGGDATESGDLYQFDIAGQCGGWVYFTPLEGSDAERTDYDLDMQEYCMSSPQGDIRFSGQIRASELTSMGMPSELLTEFSGLQANSAEDSFVVSMTGGRTVYGRPDAGRPLAPSADAPDQVSIGELVVNHQTDGITDTVQALQAERWEQDGLVITRVEDGRYVQNSSGDVFDLSTPAEPLQVDPESGEWLAGVLVLSSDDYPDVQVRPTGNPGEYTAVVPANAAGERLGCGVVDGLGSGR
ncbi:MAG: hypothetical protein P1U78_03095 [Alcanivoracaceae bacterium]|nr:hypothetical protein [Alcanivoracaceae bacterium]